MARQGVGHRTTTTGGTTMHLHHVYAMVVVRQRRREAERVAEDHRLARLLRRRNRNGT
ncbi:hypothetical protein ACFFQW_31290 [Umezawaea endophytica]